MELFPKQIMDKLLENGRLSQRDGNFDPPPVVKIFTAAGACTWLLTEVLPDQPDVAYGLCDLGMGYPELGTVLISELLEARDKLGLPLERDLFCNLDKPLSYYTEKANRENCIQV